MRSLPNPCRPALAGIVLAVVALAGAASAQVAGLFYAEEKKGDRYYVFNVKANWERFVASGETGTGLTRIGVGPNGETVFADNETALELFFFKYNIKEEVVRPKPPVQAIVWRDGKTRFTLGSNFYLELSNRIQPRFTQEQPDDSVKLPGTANTGDSRGSFTIRRAKTKFEGWFYKPELEYEFQANWPDASTAQPNRFVEDANIDWDLSRKKNKAFRIRFGQFKAPYGRQQITSSGSQQFVDRAITDGRYNPARETGLALWGTLGVNRLDWRVMVSNGNGRTQSANDNSKYLVSARVMWQAVGSARMNQWGSGVLLTEGDLGEAPDTPLLAIAGNFLNDDFKNVSTTAANNLNNTQWSLDYIFKYKGFSSVAEYHDRRSKPQAGGEFKDKGFLVQASYAFKAKGPAAFFEIAGRYAQIDPTSLRTGDKRTEAGGAVSYYYNRHTMKAQADFRNLKDDAANSGKGTSSNEFRLQWQFIF